MTTAVYRLWGQARHYCDYEITTATEYKPAIRSLFPLDWSGQGLEIERDIELIPEPNGPRGPWAISVRADGLTIGYIDDAAAPTWAGVIRRIFASGFIPVTLVRIWAYEYDGWEGIEFNATVRVLLGRPSEALPLNDPPELPYTMIPRSAFVQVTKEDQHTDALLKFVPTGGYGLLFVTLHEHVPTHGSARPHVEVRIDDERIGQLTPQMSQRFLPMIRHLSTRGLVTAWWGDITGSAVAAEVRIDGIKANEADDAVLDGPPATIPPLLPGQTDPLLYDLTAMQPRLAPTAPPRPEPPRILPEPPDGSVVRFTKGRHYNYVAVRREQHWETTASSSGGSIDQIMSWSDLSARVRQFEIATAWTPVADERSDPRIRENHAVIRFTIGGLYLAAIGIRSEYRQETDWYTTITDDLEGPPIVSFGSSFADWTDIATYGAHIQVVTAWAALI
jgi:hypothetical protein